MSQEDNFNQFVSSLEDKFVPSEETVSSAINNIRASIKEYVNYGNLQSLVVGLYGDLDSTVVAALCQEQYTGVPLLGVVIQSETRTNQAHWAGRNFCTKYHDFNALERINEEVESFINESTVEFKDFIDPDFVPKPNIASAMFGCLAQQTNGIVLGNKTWTDIFLFRENDADYSPIKSINKGFELPVVANALRIPQNIIHDLHDNEKRIGATYREADVIINGRLNNLDDNLTTQLNRFKALEKVQRVLLRFEFNRARVDVTDRNILKLPTTYKY